MDEGVSEESPHDEGLREFSLQEEQREAVRRRVFYGDVEELITIGFLTHTLDVAGVALTFRSLPFGVWSRLEARGRKNGMVFAAWFLAESLYMVDGLVVADDTNATFCLYREWLAQIPLSVLQVLCSVPNGLNARVERASRMAEAYAYEPYGRSSNSKNTSCADNLVYSIWRAHLDANELQDTDFAVWNHTITLVSAFAGSKGATAVSGGLDRARKKEKARQTRVIEDAINYCLGGQVEVAMLTVEFDGKTFEVPRVTGASTENDLFGEMGRVMSGNRDYHDEVVSRYKEGIRARIEANRALHRQTMEEATRLMQEERDSDRPSLVGYTPEQLAQLRPQSFGPSRSTVEDQSGANRLFDRYLSTETKVGWLGTQGVPEAASAKPQSSGGESLQAQVEGRRPTLHSDDPSR